MSITNLRPMVYARAAHPRLSSRCTYTSSSTSRTPRAGSSTSCIYTLRPARRAKMSTTASESTQVNTFVNQNKLPRLPIPDLEKSTQGYVKSLIPVLEQNVSHSTLSMDPSSSIHQVSPADLPKEIEKRKLFARDFVASGSIGRELQERLKGRKSVNTRHYDWAHSSFSLQISTTSHRTIGSTIHCGLHSLTIPGVHLFSSIPTTGCCSLPIPVIQPLRRIPLPLPFPPPPFLIPTTTLVLKPLKTVWAAARYG